LGSETGDQIEALEPPKGVSGVISGAVCREDLERQLEVVRALAPGKKAGVFGPDSLTWRIDREALTFLGAGRALLLQLAHPWVAAAIVEHSRTLGDPIDRFHRTFAVVFTMVFGTLDQALSAARSLHRRHAAIHGRLPITVGPFQAGSPYQANDLAALRWVHATLIESALIAHDFVLPPLTVEERARYYSESHLFAALFGIPRATLPADWTAFVAYAEMMRESDLLTVGPAAREIAGQIFSGAGMWMRPPQWYRAITASMLPPRLREAYGFSEADRSQSERARAWLRRIYPRLPARLRHVGPYQEAMARLSGRASPDFATRALNRLWIGRHRLAG
jgi:uncharacterized protein (DUF2236 family)